MTTASDYFENEILDHTYNDGSWTAPTTFYIALCTAPTADSDGAGDLTEATYTGYARKSFLATDLDAAASGSKTNGNAITFAACTGGSSTVTHIAIVDSASGAGNIIQHGAIDSSLAVSNGVTPEFAVGALTFTCD